MKSVLQATLWVVLIAIGLAFANNALRERAARVPFPNELKLGEIRGATNVISFVAPSGYMQTLALGLKEVPAADRIEGTIKLHSMDSRMNPLWEKKFQCSLAHTNVCLRVESDHVRSAYYLRYTNQMEWKFEPGETNILRLVFDDGVSLDGSLWLVYLSTKPTKHPERQP